jgi:hypothetical protein
MRQATRGHMPQLIEHSKKRHAHKQRPVRVESNFTWQFAACQQLWLLPALVLLLQHPLLVMVPRVILL